MKVKKAAQRLCRPCPESCDRLFWASVRAASTQPSFGPPRVGAVSWSGDQIATGPARTAMPALAQGDLWKDFQADKTRAEIQEFDKRRRVQ